MIDTVGIWFSGESLYHLDLLSQLPQRLTNVEEKYSSRSGDSITGNLENLRVRISNERVGIIGSVPKYVLGDNFQIADRKTIYQFCEKCSDVLHFNVGKGNLYRIDMGLNLETIHKPTLYYPYLGGLQHFKRLEQPDSIRYQNGVRNFVIYDKLKQTKAGSQKVPKAFWGKYIMRMEYRLPKTRSIKDHFPFASQLRELWEKQVFDKMENTFKEVYHQINKVHGIKIDRAIAKTDKAFARQLQALGMAQLGGYDRAIAFAKELKEGRYLNCDKSYQRMRTRLKNLQREYGESYPNDFIQELDALVNGFTI